MTDEKQSYKSFQMLPETTTKLIETNRKGGITLRILEFDVQKQRLNKHKGCDFSGLVAGSVGYLHAKFYFLDSDWSRCPNKFAKFWINGQEHAKQLDGKGCCEIPSEVLVGGKFEVSVLGVSPRYQIETNKITVRQGVN